jgi:hypothetical protein
MSEEEDDTINVSKRVILTSSKSNFSFKNTVDFLVSDIEDQGSLFLKKEFFKALDNPNIDCFILLFDRSNTFKHFKFLQTQVDNWIAEKDISGSPNKHKIVCFVVYRKFDSRVKDIEYLGTNWKYIVIENLSNTSYRTNLELVDMDTFEISQKIQKNVDDYSLAQIFISSFKSINFKKKLGEFVKDKCISFLISIKKKDKNSSNSFFMKFLRTFYESLENSQDFKQLPNWKNYIFEQVLKNSNVNVSISNIVQNVFSSVLTKHLKSMFIEMKKEHVLGTLFNIDNLEYDIKKKFEQFFNIELKKLMSNLR